MPDILRRIMTRLTRIGNDRDASRISGTLSSQIVRIESMANHLADRWEKQ